MPRENIHAFTQTAPASFPGYLSLNREADGQITLTVRSPGNGGREQATIPLTSDQLDDLAAAILHHNHLNRS